MSLERILMRDRRRDVRVVVTFVLGDLLLMLTFLAASLSNGYWRGRRSRFAGRDPALRR